jgi:hypothetical protein
MEILLLVVLLVGLATALSPRCGESDAAIYRAQGDTFERRFRALGGLFVSRSEFVDAVVRISGLSHSCADCYGGAYDCGWNECKGSCMIQGARCTACLVQGGCTAALSECTGGFGQPKPR